MAIECKVPNIQKRKGKKEKNQFIYRVIMDDNVDSPNETPIREYPPPNMRLRLPECMNSDIYLSQQSMCNPNSDYGSDSKGLTSPPHNRIDAQSITLCIPLIISGQGLDPGQGITSVWRDPMMKPQSWEN